MKIAHLKPNHSDAHSPIDKGSLHEKNGEYAEAAVIYEHLLKERSTDETIYNRLMIIYRKQKEYRKELKTIVAGIKAFEELYTRNTKHGSKIAKVSLALAKSTGLVDKKGKNVFDPEPIAKWKKRKVVVEGKLKSTS